jgi:cytochrome P450
VISVDLDSPDATQLEKLWNELRHRRQLRSVDPGLRRACEIWISALEDRELAAELTSELATVTPEAFLDARWAELLP